MSFCHMGINIFRPPSDPMNYEKDLSWKSVLGSINVRICSHHFHGDFPSSRHGTLFYQWITDDSSSNSHREVYEWGFERGCYASMFCYNNYLLPRYFVDNICRTIWESRSWIHTHTLLIKKLQQHCIFYGAQAKHFLWKKMVLPQEATIRR